MKYVISTNGANIAVGLLDANTAEEDINLSHNLFNTHAGDSYYNGVLSFASPQKFYRFLIDKYYLLYWQPDATFSQLLKKATNKARQILVNDVEYRNFMPEIYHSNIVSANNNIHKWHSPKYSD